MTRYGTLALIAGAVSLAIGRVFGVIELFVIGAGFLGAFIMALARVLLRTPHVSGVRRVRPVTLVAGETGIVDLHLEHHGTIRSTRFDLHERVRRANVGDRMADLTVEPIAAGGTATASYHLPTASRGLIELGPLEAEGRRPARVAASDPNCDGCRPGRSDPPSTFTRNAAARHWTPRTPLARTGPPTRTR